MIEADPTGERKEVAGLPMPNGTAIAYKTRRALGAFIGGKRQPLVPELGTLDLPSTQPRWMHSIRPFLPRAR